MLQWQCQFALRNKEFANVFVWFFNAALDTHNLPNSWTELRRELARIKWC
jgi:hypothetical protein